MKVGLTPQEKKRLSYERDHYNRNGENNKSWRKTKPLKKKKAWRRFRKASNDLTKIIGEGDGPANAERKSLSLKRDRVYDWGSIKLRDFVQTRRIGRGGMSKAGATISMQSAAAIQKENSNLEKRMAAEKWWIRDKDIAWAMYGGRSGAIRSTELYLIHTPTKIRVVKEVPSGIYVNKEFRALQNLVWKKLTLELNAEVAKALHIPGR